MIPEDSSKLVYPRQHSRVLVQVAQLLHFEVRDTRNVLSVLNEGLLATICLLSNLHLLCRHLSAGGIDVV